MAELPPLVVAVPLLVAALLMAVERIATRRVVDAVAVAASVVVTAMCALLTAQALQAPGVYWFGGWEPQNGVALGVAFVADSGGAGLATFAAFLLTAAFVFSWRYFEAVGTLFHALMLVFLAGMVGFCLAGDLFTLFVFFELMSVASYVLTGYKIEEGGPLQGALNLAVTNSIGATFILVSIALLYGRTGALNLAQVGRTLAGGPVDGLVVASFVLISAGFFVKAAIVPFHFAHADAHAAAPTPVLVLFSGVLLQLGLYGVVRVYWTAFSGALGGETQALRTILLGAGVMTALLGSVMCFAQQHLKRLLAFSTIGHVGLFLIGAALFTPRGLAGTGLYVVSHGMVKGTLFLCVGILLHREGSIDELALRGRGKRLRVTGACFVLGGLGLAGLPPFGTFLGKALVEESAASLGCPWITAVFVVTSVLTGGAALRAAGRIFAGWGPIYEEISAPEGEQEEPEQETEEGHSRTPPVMLLPVVMLLLVAVLSGLAPDLAGQAETAAAHFQDRAAYASLVLGDQPREAYASSEHSGVSAKGLTTGLASAAGAVGLALFALFRQRLPLDLSRSWRKFVVQPVAGLKALHNGHVGDYVTWLTIGVAVLGGICAFILL